MKSIRKSDLSEKCWVSKSHLFEPYLSISELHTEVPTTSPHLGHWGICTWSNQQLQVQTLCAPPLPFLPFTAGYHESGSTCGRGKWVIVFQVLLFLLHISTNSHSWVVWAKMPVSELKQLNQGNLLASFSLPMRAPTPAKSVEWGVGGQEDVTCCF